MKTFLLVAVILLACVRAEAASTHPRKLQVFVLAGQSNMDGRADFGKISAADRERLERVQDRVQLAYNLQPPGLLTGAKGSAGLKEKFGADFSFGPEIFFGIRLAEAYPEDRFLLIKRSVGATSLYGRWNPEWNAEKAKVMNEENVPALYPDMVSYVRRTLAGYDSGTHEIRGMLWVQGETDGSVSKFGPVPSKAYGENIQKLIRYARDDFGVPDLPFLIVRVSMGDVGRGMDEAAERMVNVTVIPRILDPASPNFLQQYEVGHYNHVGMKRMGDLLADAWLVRYASAPVSTAAREPAR